MFENYLLIAVVIIVLWLVGFGAYLVSSRRQRDIETEIIKLDDMLNNDKHASSA